MRQIAYASRTAIHFIMFNLGWWACALGAVHGYPWAGPALVPLGVGLHLRFSPQPIGELLFFIELGAVGWILDSLLLWGGLFTLSTPTSFAPLWLVAMWVLLGLTFEGMLSLRRQPRLLLAIGALTGPLSYVWCEAVGLLTYAHPLWASLSIHSFIWAILTPLLFKLRDRALNVRQVQPMVVVAVEQPEEEFLDVAFPVPEVEPDHYKAPTAPTWH